MERVDLNKDPKAKVDFGTGLQKLKELELWAFTESVNPWVIRQLLVFALEVNTLSAKRRGIKQEALEVFDGGVIAQARRIDAMPETGA